MRRHAIFNAWRHFSIDRTLDYSIRFQFAKARGEHMLRNTRNGPLQLVKSSHALGKLAKDHKRPFAGQDFERRLDFGRRPIKNISIYHALIGVCRSHSHIFHTTPLIPSYFFYSSWDDMRTSSEMR